LRSYGVRQAATVYPKRGVLRGKTPEVNAALRQLNMIDTWVTVFELMLFGVKAL
jgi:hypothetical protein